MNANAGKVNDGFGKIIASLDDDRDLFAAIAVPVSRHYAAYADELRSLLDSAEGREAIERVVHKVKATWSLYAIEHPDLPERIEDAMDKEDTGSATALVELLVQSLRAVSSELQTWVECHSRNKA